ncbi:carbohydrate-binding domain-containing protein [Longirhabdus pacifica]|uniref:carbohydrate-binding domain-containing protein n=1 Tax=Longirhabdus pacifica TaxID=2305227 RepID=UPI001008EFF6|nr:carbohydrate-binding domain-containing protein [Longirhabdus pacifica]
MKKIFLLLSIFSLTLTLYACSSETEQELSIDTGGPLDEETNDDSVDSMEDDAEDATTMFTAITLGDEMMIDGEGATSTDNVVTIEDGGVYRISGTLADGQLLVNTSEEVTLELDGVFISNSSGPAVMVENALEVTVTLLEGTTNTLMDNVNNSENDAVFYSNGTVVFDGEGALIVEAINHEGIASDANIIVNSGLLYVTAPDDGMNVSEDITINGGEIYINAYGDGIDSNGTIHVNGGTIISIATTNDENGGIDSNGDDFIVTGGTIFATGARISIPTADSTQAGIYYDFESNQSAESTITITADGTELASIIPEQEFQVVYFTSEDMTVDEVYTISMDDTVVGESTAALTFVGESQPGEPQSNTNEGQ